MDLWPFILQAQTPTYAKKDQGNCDGHNVACVLI